EEQALLARIPVADTRDSLRIVMHRDEARLFLDRDGDLVAIDAQKQQLDGAVFLVLAELARQRADARQPDAQQPAEQQPAEQQPAAQQPAAQQADAGSVETLSSDSRETPELAIKF